MTSTYPTSESDPSTQKADIIDSESHNNPLLSLLRHDESSEEHSSWATQLQPHSRSLSPESQARLICVPSDTADSPRSPDMPLITVECIKLDSESQTRNGQILYTLSSQVRREGNTQEHSVQRTYDDFVTLDRIVRKDCADCIIPALPPNIEKDRQPPRLVRILMRLLELYAREMARHAPLVSRTIVHAFFESPYSFSNDHPAPTSEAKSSSWVLRWWKNDAEFKQTRKSLRKSEQHLDVSKKGFDRMRKSEERLRRCLVEMRGKLTNVGAIARTDRLRENCLLLGNTLDAISEVPQPSEFEYFYPVRHAHILNVYNALDTRLENLHALRKTDQAMQKHRGRIERMRRSRDILTEDVDRAIAKLDQLEESSRIQKRYLNAITQHLKDELDRISNQDLELTIDSLAVSSLQREQVVLDILEHSLANMRGELR